MNVLVVGGGGREHALGWGLRNDPRVNAVFFAPGNAGTGEVGPNIDLAATDMEGIAGWCAQAKPDLVVVGPEAPLCAGLADRLRAEGVLVFGPGADGARLEGSKAFTKILLQEAGVPTARCACFTDYRAALAYSRSQPYPQVIKANGLAAGKGVVIAGNAWEAAAALYDMMAKRIFGPAGAEVLIEEFLEGEEVSVHAVTDGQRLIVLPPAQDHKRIFDGDRGPNTGGMGAYAPAPLVNAEGLEKVRTTILEPVLRALREQGIEYRGVLYAGLMMTQEGPKVLEFNARFGDPETQVLVPLIREQLLDLLLGAAQGDLGRCCLPDALGAALTVVVAAEGYPEQPRLGDPIVFPDGPSAGGMVFHAGTRLTNGHVVTAGGRVAAATGWGETLEEALRRAYALAEGIQFRGRQFRSDIGRKAFLRP
ncbi:MAG: phosphoribosylamine--glycine ligase [Candidatus Methylacidiphilales bacterium]